MFLNLIRMILVATERMESAKLVFIFLVVLSISGCATTDKVPIIDTFPKAYLSAPTVVSYDKKSTIILRYVSSVSDKAKASYKLKYLYEQPFQEPFYSSDVDENAHIASLIKTNYYTLELYNYLSNNLEANILLQPIKLDINQNGQFIRRTGFKAPPADAAIEFHTYVHPSWEPIASIASTVGKTVVPIISMYTSPEQAEITEGALINMAPLMPFIIPDKQATGIDAGARASLVEMLNANRENVDIQKNKTDEKPNQQIPSEVGRLLQYPAYGYKVKEYDASFLYAGFMSGISDALRKITLPNIDETQSYIARYDAKLAKRYASQRLKKSDSNKLRLIDKFIELEINFLKDVDKRYVKNMLNGDWGAGIHVMREAESSAIFKANVIGWGGALLAVATVGVAPGNSALTNSVAQITTKAVDSVSNSFDQHFEPILDEVTSVTLTYANKTIVIKTKSLKELRAKLLSVYKKHTRAG